MNDKKNLINAFLYGVFVIVIETVFYYAVDLLPAFADYAMFTSLALFSVVAWMLKPNLIFLVNAAIFIMLYGVASYYLSFPIYHVGYPLTLEEFLPNIGVKALFSTLPLVFVVAFKKKK